MTKYRVLVKFHHKTEPDWFSFDSATLRALFIISMSLYADVLSEDLVAE